MSGLMCDFHLAQPGSTKDAVAAHRDHAGSRFIAGGTDLLVNMRHGLGSADLLIDLSGIAELATITLDDNGARIGAAVTLAALARHPVIAADYRAVAQAAEAIARWPPSAATFVWIRAASTTIRANGGAKRTASA